MSFGLSISIVRYWSYLGRYLRNKKIRSGLRNKGCGYPIPTQLGIIDSFNFSLNWTDGFHNQLPDQIKERLEPRLHPTESCQVLLDLSLSPCYMLHLHNLSRLMTMNVWRFRNVTKECLQLSCNPIITHQGSPQLLSERGQVMKLQTLLLGNSIDTLDFMKYYSAFTCLMLSVDFDLLIERR